MPNTLPTDSNSVLYEGARDTSGQQFVAKQGIGTVTTDGGGVKSQAQAVGSVDGAHATLGAQADAAYTGSGSASVVAAIKGVYTTTSGAKTDLDTLAGTVSGGKVLTSEANSAAIKTNTSAFADATTSGNLTAASGGAPSSLTASNTSAVVLALGGGQATALFSITGTFVGTINFYASGDGGTTYSTIMANQGSTIGTSTTSTGVWRANVAGYTHVAAVMNPYTSGTATVRINASAQPNNVTINNATALGQATMANSAPVVLASDQTVPIQGQFKEIIGQGTGVVTGVNTDFIPMTDVSAYKHFSLHVTGTFVLTMQVQGSNDGTNFSTLYSYSTASPSSSNIGTTITSTGIWQGPIPSRYLRVRVTAFTSNASMAGTLELFATPPVLAYNNLNVIPTPATSGGNSIARIQSAATTNATSAKASAGQLYSFHFGNSGASDAWVKLYNKASAPTVGTDTPVESIYVPKGGTATWHDTLGEVFSTGIAYAITGGAADSDTTAVAANQVTGKIAYK